MEGERVVFSGRKRAGPCVRRKVLGFAAPQPGLLDAAGLRPRPLAMVRRAGLGACVVAAPK